MMNKRRQRAFAIRVALAAILLPVDGARAGASPVSDPVARWRPIIVEASLRFGVPIAWIERVLRVESGGRTTIAGRPIRSRAGAIGLMQLMPGTWRSMRDAYALGANPDDPRDNILAGTAYLRLMRDRFGYPGLFGAYNAGPARYADYLAGRSRLPSETITYVARLTGARTSEITLAASPPQLLFALRRGLPEKPQAQSDRVAGDGLFAIRNDVSR